MKHAALILLSCFAASAALAQDAPKRKYGKQ